MCASAPSSSRSSDFPLLLDDARFAENLGLDNILIADNVIWAPIPDMPVLEAWTTLAGLAAGIARVRLGPLVTNVAARNPAMLANVSYAGKHFAFDDASVHPTPTQLPPPPLWIAAQGPASLRVAARHGNALVTMGDGNTEESLAAFKARIGRFETICEAEGRDPQSIRRCFFGGGQWRANV